MVTGNSGLLNLTGLRGLKTVTGTFEVSFNQSMQSLSGIEKLDSVGGFTQIYSNYSLTSLAGLNGLKTLAGRLYLSQNLSLQSLTGLDNLKYIGGNFEIWNCHALQNLQGLGSLGKIAGDLIINYNNTLASLEGAGNLRKIGGDLSLNTNSSLTSLDGLTNLPNDSLASFGITGNLLLGSCNISCICHSIHSHFDVGDISANAVNCNTKKEVLSHCDTLSAGNLAAYPAVRIFPDPATSFILVEVQDLVPGTLLTITDVMAAEVARLTLTGTRTSVDISTLPKGIYMVSISNSRYHTTLKFIRE
jgi:hypothetical protein